MKDEKSRKKTVVILKSKSITDVMILLQKIARRTENNNMFRTMKISKIHFRT
jgi:hypothetical protein